MSPPLAVMSVVPLMVRFFEVAVTLPPETNLKLLTLRNAMTEEPASMISTS